MTIAEAHDKLKAADEALAAAKVIRGEAFEALIAAAAGEGWRVIFRHTEGGRERIVVEDAAGRSGDIEDVVALLLRGAVA